MMLENMKTQRKLLNNYNNTFAGSLSDDGNTLLRVSQITTNSYDRKYLVLNGYSTNIRRDLTIVCWFHTIARESISKL